jgi:hypothetical protein
VEDADHFLPHLGAFLRLQASHVSHGPLIKAVSTHSGIKGAQHQLCCPSHPACTLVPLHLAVPSRAQAFAWLFLLPKCSSHPAVTDLEVADCHGPRGLLGSWGSVIGGDHEVSGSADSEGSDI